MKVETIDFEFDLSGFMERIAALQEEFKVPDLVLVAALGATAGDIAGVHVSFGCCDKLPFEVNLVANFAGAFTHRMEHEEGNGEVRH